MESFFAKPERSSDEDIMQDTRLLHEEKTLLDIMGAISGITAILDNKRQIIYANNSFMNLLGLENIGPILGSRPGEAIGCIHSGDMEAGCGTSMSCAHCGAVTSIIESQQTGKKSIRETRITSETYGKTVNWDLRVTTSPIKLRNRTYYVFGVEDISNEKRKQILERIFFHDILNSAGNLSGLLSLLKEGSDPIEDKELIELSEESSRELVDEIIVHRQLRSAENGDLIVNRTEINPLLLLQAAAARISKNEIAVGKKIAITNNAGDVTINSDKVLLQQVLFNMLKNALEATESNGIVDLSVESLPGKVRIKVKNDQAMAENVRLQVFQRSFSTKGSGRGIGTYSIKLLTENYLGGKAEFSSTEREGTIFWIDLPYNS